jgi:L-2-hydroxyglutarate oxidase
MDNKVDVLIVGGGIVGAATYYKTALAHPELSVAIIEKENTWAAHQTGNNSGVIHSGLYYKPGSSKAYHCVKGRHELVAFCQKYGVDHDVCGKVVVATQEAELPYLDKIFDNGIANNTEGIEKIDVDRLNEIEPNVKGIAAIWVPCTGIVDFKGATEKMVTLGTSFNPNNSAALNTAFLDIKNLGDKSLVRTQSGTIEAKQVIFCGGLQADRLAKADNINLKEKVVGFRGDYYELTEQAKHKVKNLIYPVPNPDFPFLGVHFTRMTNGEIECGPNAVFTFKREGYSKTAFNLRDTLDALSYKGTWKLFFKNMSFGINEYRRAFSKKRFLKTLQVLIPSLTMDDIKPARSGVRALLLSEEGDTRDDFRIEKKGNNIHVLNAPSPAATSALAIADSIVKQL